jgi:hypothetical protein
VNPLILDGGISSMMISCGQGESPFCHCVCQIVVGSPSTALTPLPSCATVSALSTLTALSAIFSVVAADIASIGTDVAAEAAFVGTVVAVGVASVGVDLKIFPPNTNAAAITAQNKMTKAIFATGDFFAGGVSKFVSDFGTDCLRAFEPVMINSTSSLVGACGTMILWKHDGHSIIELLRHDSHLMFCPQAGQANLNSLMLLEAAFHIRASLATGFFKGFFPASL